MNTVPQRQQDFPAQNASNPSQSHNSSRAQAIFARLSRNVDPCLRCGWFSILTKFGAARVWEGAGFANHPLPMQLSFIRSLSHTCEYELRCTEFITYRIQELNWTLAPGSRPRACVPTREEAALQAGAGLLKINGDSMAQDAFTAQWTSFKGLVLLVRWYVAPTRR